MNTPCCPSPEDLEPVPLEEGLKTEAATTHPALMFLKPGAVPELALTRMWAPRDRILVPEEHTTVCWRLRPGLASGTGSAGTSLHSGVSVAVY